MKDLICKEMNIKKLRKIKGKNRFKFLQRENKEINFLNKENWKRWLN